MHFIGLYVYNKKFRFGNLMFVLKNVCLNLEDHDQNGKGKLEHLYGCKNVSRKSTCGVSKNLNSRLN